MHMMTTDLNLMDEVSIFVQGGSLRSSWTPSLGDLLQMPRAHEATCYGRVFIQYEPSHMLEKLKCDWSLMPSQNFASCHSSNKIVEFLNNLSCIEPSVNQKGE